MIELIEGEEAEVMGHAVERLDDLNTRSYHWAVLELTNRREKLLGGGKEPIRSREASTQMEFLEHVANTGIVVAPCSVMTRHSRFLAVLKRGEQLPRVFGFAQDSSF